MKITSDKQIFPSISGSGEFDVTVVPIEFVLWKWTLLQRRLLHLLNT